MPNTRGSGLFSVFHIFRLNEWVGLPVTYKMNSLPLGNDGIAIQID